MKDKLLIVSALALVASSLASACSSDDDSEGGGDGGTSSDGGGATGGSGGGDSGAGGGSAGTGGGSAGTGGGSAGTGGGSGTNCDMTPCEGRMFMGMPAPTCCIDATTCGVGTGAQCFDPSVLDNLPEGGFFGPPEPIVEDPDCMGTELMFMGMAFTLGGCCDASGVCGFTAMGLEQCITPDDAAGFLMGADAGAEVPCDYPADAGGSGAGGRGGGGRDGG